MSAALRLVVAVLVFLYLGCGDEGHAVPARYLVARRALVATDDPGYQLRRGFGVEVVEVRDGLVRTREGHWLPADGLEPAPVAIASAEVSPAAAIARPVEVAPDERWIDVDTAAQRLTAYEGDRVVRTVKISTGVGEEGAPYATPRGAHRIYAKLRAATMASAPPAPGQPPDPHPYRFEGVPHVQYFDREIALHGAYWHRRFGERVSHGCVNLAPADAAWLFDFTSPRVGDHAREAAAPAGKGGTLVRVR